MRMVNGFLRLTASDLVNHLACRHLTHLDFEVALGERERPDHHDPTVQMLQRKGDEHENQYIDHLKAAGHKVTVIKGTGISAADVEETSNAMREGREIIVQGSLAQGRWAGRADILRRTTVPSQLGGWSYEVIDTKLARETKAGTILQLSLYSELVSGVQGTLPEYMYVVTPWTGFFPQRYRTDDYSAYHRLIKGRLERYFDTDERRETYPDPREHCRICAWKDHCDAVRREDDHVGLVGGISGSQIEELRRNGVTRIGDLADLQSPIGWVTRATTAAKLGKLKQQAQLQLSARETGPMYRALVPQEPGTGLAGMPEPTAQDIFFSFERAPFAGPNGIQYLLGVVATNDTGVSGYTGEWAMTEAQEKEAFEAFVDAVMAKWSRHPDLHVYHYGRSGPNAMVRLAGRLATREEEVEKILNAGLLVNLYPALRDGVQASVENYSLRELEPYFGFDRTVPVAEAEESMRSIASVMELGYPGEILDVEQSDREVVQAYNHDNCRSVFHLREWLERLRDELVSQGVLIDRPIPAAGRSTGPETETQAIIGRLSQGIPKEPSSQSKEQHARWVLSNILNWHRQEEVAALEEFDRLADCSSDGLLDEGKALVGLEHADFVGTAWGREVHRFTFPPQETSLAAGEELYERGGIKIGQVDALDIQELTVDIAMEYHAEGYDGGHAIGFADIPLDVLKRSLTDLGLYVSQRGMSGSGEHGLARDLLLKNRPRPNLGVICLPSETAMDAALRIAGEGDFGVLPVQGPPGSGKTYLGARMMCELVRRGARVGITANSHRVISNLMETLLEVAGEQGVGLRAVQRGGRRDPPTQDDRVIVARNYDQVLQNFKSGCQVAAGTAWMWSRLDFRGTVDYLFVDEAAQMTLANVLASARAARNLVLLGDPQQLDQPVRGTHPEGIDVSALGYLLSGRPTIGDEEGIFLPETFRLHPEICSFTSEAFYEGRLDPRAGLEQQKIVSDGALSGSGLRYLPVDHSGNRTSSDEEATVVAKLVRDLVTAGSSWVDQDGMTRPIRWEDVLTVAPYNAHVQRILAQLPEGNVGTVDKFQGQEAPVVIYSMGTSSPSEAPRGLEFLYSLNRLNVATSRARCLCLVVAAPALFEPDCRTPKEMQLANALCRYRELATEIAI